MYYLDLIKLGFTLNPVQTVLYSIPALLLGILLLSSIYACFSNKEYLNGDRDFFSMLFNISPRGEMIFGMIVLFFIFIFSLPTFKWLEIDSNYSIPIAQSLYPEQNKKLQGDDLIVLHNLELQKKEMEFFKMSLMHETPKGQAIYQKDVDQMFKEKKTAYLQCVNSKQENYLQDLKKASYKYGSIYEDINDFPNICAVEIAKDLISTKKQ